MSIVRYDPFRDLRTLQEEVNRLFSTNLTRGFGEESIGRGAWNPSVDIYENKDHIVLEAEVAVEIYLGRHDGLARQVDAQRPGRDLQLTSPADACELVVLDDECGALDGGAAIARDEPRPFEHRDASGPGLAVHAPGKGHCREETCHDDEERVREM